MSHGIRHARTCQWHDEDEDDEGRITFGPVCGEPALFMSCMPYDRTPTCAKHKCRCAKPLAAPPAVPAPWSPERRERVGRAVWEVVLRIAAPARGSSAEGTPWLELPEFVREDYRAMGEAAVRADEEGSR